MFELLGDYEYKKGPNITLSDGARSHDHEDINKIQACPNHPKPFSQVQSAALINVCPQQKN